MARAERARVVEELRDRIVAGIHVGRLHGGTRLPSVRTLAAQFGVNERVVLAALGELESDGFVERRARSGTYVAPLHAGAGAAPLPDLGLWLVGMLMQARARGLAPRHVAEYARQAMETRRLRAACIECNDDQLHLLCGELADDHGFITESSRLEALHTDDPPPTVMRADILVTTAFHADKVRRVASALGKPWIAVELRADTMREVGHHLRAGPVYYVAIDPRFERKLRRMTREVGPVANLRVMLIGRDDLGDIPPNAPTFVMPSAREAVRRRFGGQPPPGRPIQPARHLSDESARELLTFAVRANMQAQQAGLGVEPRSGAQRAKR